MERRGKSGFAQSGCGQLVRSVVMAAMFAGVMGMTTSCGKNQAFMPAGYIPAPNMAPYPTTMPNGYFGGQSPYQNSPYSYPQLPQTMPNQYYPFIPVDNFMRNYPGYQGYWQQTWQNWQNHCSSYQCNPYDFSLFWTSYCPSQWRGTQLMDVYNYLNTYVYFWVSPNMWFMPMQNPSRYWTRYSSTPSLGWGVSAGF